MLERLRRLLSSSFRRVPAFRYFRDTAGRMHRRDPRTGAVENLQGGKWHAGETVQGPGDGARLAP